MPRFPNGIKGLEDLIAGVTPTLVDWTADPTDAADITDGDISTFCTTGNKITVGAWQFGYFEWDLGAFYNVLLSGVGGMTTDAGSPVTNASIWDGTAWIDPSGNLSGLAAVKNYINYTGFGSKVRMGITSSAAATITPNIREFHAWRLQ